MPLIPHGVDALHVESVAWISERKDVLSTFFLLLTLWAYHSYALRPGMRRYLLVALLFALGLMAKPMLVTLPLVLLLLDFWPLRRLQTADCRLQLTTVAEKIPLFAMSLGSCIATIIAQQGSDAVVPIKGIPIGIRMENTLVSYAVYIGKMFWPAKLAIFYPHPVTMLPLWQMILAALLLIGISIVAMRGVRERPYLRFGWLWYVLTMIPVIGIVQVGQQAMADRYTYIPFIGLFIMVAWGIPELLKRISPITFPIGSVAIVGILAGCTIVQAGHWKDSRSLFEHALRVTKGNYVAHSNLGVFYADHDDLPRAEEHFRAVAQLQPRSVDAHRNLAEVLSHQNKLEEAKEEYRAIARLRPESAKARNDLGSILVEQEKYDEAITEYKKAIELDPDFAIARRNLDMVLKRNTLAASSDKTAKILYNKGLELQAQGDMEGAEKEYRRAIRLKPSFTEAHNNLGLILKDQGKLDEAIREYHTAIQIKQDFGQAYNNLAIALYFSGEYAEAWKEVQLYRKYGGSPHPGFIQALSEKMPEPGR